LSLAIVHIGAGKTGSTAIQNALTFNAATLSENGLVYPRLISQPHGIIDHNRLAYALFDDRDFADLDETKRQLTAIAESGKTLILSAEVFYMRPFESDCASAEAYLQKKRESIHKLRELLAAYGRVKIVCYVRRQDLWFESIYNERIKQNKHAGLSFEAFVTEMGQGHYAQQLDLWAECVGAENVIVRPYERQQLCGSDVVHDFAELLGIAHLIKPAPATLVATNPRLSRDVLEFEKIIWRVEKDPLQQRLISDALRKISEEMQTISPEPEGWQYLMSMAARQVLLESYAESNAYVANTYLGKDDGVLFTEALSVEMAGETYPGLSVERAMETLIRLEIELSRPEIRRQRMISKIQHWVRKKLPLLRPILSPLGRHYQKMRTRKRYGY